MDPTTAEAPPGCLIILIAQSAAMADDARVRFPQREIDGEPDIRDALELLSADAFDPRLKTHKLTGELNDVWACSAS